MLKLLVVIVLAAALGACRQAAATREHSVRVVTQTRGLEHPWGLVFLPDGRQLVTERPGRMRIVNRDGTLDPAPIAGLPRVDAQSQGGLLDVALHPQYASNGWIYWTYAQKDADGRNGTELARGKLAGGSGQWRVESVEVLFRALPKSNGGHHFGSRIVFDRAGFLFLTLGERGEMARAQKLEDDGGKIVRLTDDGKPAPGNPFMNEKSARPEIYSLGHRNVQGAAIRPSDGSLWVSEHGPQGGDELNLIRAGANYGWPIITYGVNYGIGSKIGEGTEKPGMEQPVKYWTPSPALSGIVFYEGNRFPHWRDDLLMAALKSQAIVRVRLDGGRFVEDEFMLEGRLPRVRHVVVGPDGFVYVLTDEDRGAILRLEPAD